MSNETRMEIMKELKWRGSTHACPSCDQPAYCAMEDGKSGSLCWCMSIDKNISLPANAEQCLCKRCLTKEVECTSL